MCIQATASVAQLAERAAFNRVVRGSSPRTGVFIVIVRGNKVCVVPSTYGEVCSIFGTIT